MRRLGRLDPANVGFALAILALVIVAA